jgi:aspartate/methionine/tyrosine aminotransferase
MCVALSTHSQVSSLVVPFVESAALTDSMIATLCNQSRPFLEESRDIVVVFLEKRDIEFVPATAGLFIFAKLSLSSIDSEKALEKKLSKRGIVLASGTGYHCKEPGWFRICFSFERSKLVTALGRLGQVLDPIEEDNSHNVEPKVQDQRFEGSAILHCNLLPEDCPHEIPLHT